MKAIRFLAVLSIQLLCACSSLVQSAAVEPDSYQLQQALSGVAVLGVPYKESDLPDDNLFGLTPEMAAFAESAVKGIHSSDRKAEALHVKLFARQEQGGRGLVYSALTTTTGIEAFDRRQVNCLSYSLLYAAMAQHIGLRANFNDVTLPPKWEMRSDNSYLFMRHMNVKVLLNNWGFRVAKIADVGAIVVDLEMSQYRTHYKQELITPTQAAAQYYSNRGLEYAAAQEPTVAFLYLRKALLLNDKKSYIWSNLGSFYRRIDKLELAEAVYLKGLQINKRDLTIMHNLAGLYGILGMTEKQAYYAEKVRRHREANPYYQYNRAREFMDLNQYAEAKVLIEHAISKEKREVRFYALAAEIYTQLGNLARAEQMRNKVKKIEAESALN